jgi:hypothetical protein
MNKSTFNFFYRWEFMSEDSDIGFSVYYLERNGDRVDIITNERVQSHLMMEEGDVVCVRPVLCRLLDELVLIYLHSFFFS